MSKWVEGRVVANRHWTESLYSLQVSADVEPFAAGQFTRIALDIDGERLARPYSYVNAPGEQPLEFYSVIVPGGPLSTRLVLLEPGDAIHVTPRASGLLTLADVGDAENLWLLSTGTALGPFLSILRTAEPWQRFSRIVLAHAVRHAAELTYREVIGQLQAQYAGRLDYVPLVTRETAEHALRARIPAAIADGSFEARVGLDLRPGYTQVMLCGNPAMVQDTTAALDERGFRLNKRRDPGDITVEKYWKE